MTKLSIEDVKTNAHKVALAVLGGGVVAFEAGKKASDEAKSQIQTQADKSTALFDTLVTRGEKVESDGKAKLEEIKLPEVKLPEFKKPELKLPEFKKPAFKIPAVVTEAVDKVKAKVEPVKDKFFSKAA